MNWKSILLEYVLIFFLLHSHPLSARVFMDSISNRTTVSGLDEEYLNFCRLQLESAMATAGSYPIRLDDLSAVDVTDREFFQLDISGFVIEVTPLIWRDLEPSTQQAILWQMAASFNQAFEHFQFRINEELTSWEEEKLVQSLSDAGESFFSQYISTKVGTFSQEDEFGPNCFNASLKAVGFDLDEEFSSGDTMQCYLQNGFHQVREATQVGDLMVIWKDWQPLHAATFIGIDSQTGEELYFTKNGHRRSRFMIMTQVALKKIYSQQVNFYRRRLDQNNFQCQ
ncbi:MAG: hypothetical protein CMP10_04325 [Zetaproteobacteria bacterium]|nr:hypothetical protein [Pseudobdellovibrionaceae bacterium]